MKNIIIKSIESLYKWLKSPEGLFILMSGGYERTFRDKLMFQIQSRVSDHFVLSEKTFDKKRPDILIRPNKKDWEKYATMIEMKINSFNQITEITGKSLKEVERELKFDKKISTKNVKNRLTADFDRWYLRKSKKPVYFIYLIVEVKKLGGDFGGKVNYLYKSHQKSPRYKFKDINTYLNNFSESYHSAKIYLSYQKKLFGKCNKPISVVSNIYVYLYEMF